MRPGLAGLHPVLLELTVTHLNPDAEAPFQGGLARTIVLPGEHWR